MIENAGAADLISNGRLQLGISLGSPEQVIEGWRHFGSASNATAVWAAERGMNLPSSTLRQDESGEPFHVPQARQIRIFRKAWANAGVIESILRHVAPGLGWRYGLGRTWSRRVYANIDVWLLV